MGSSPRSSGSAPRPMRRSPTARTSSSSRTAVGPERVAMPSLLAVGAIHHHLVRAGTRLQAGLVVESGEPRSVQSVAVLIGYGAAAVNPYLMLATIGQLVAEGRLDMRLEDAEERALEAVGKGLLKTISKMGISTLSSYCGAQVFEAVGLSTGPDRQALHRHAVAHRRHRHARARRRRARSARARLSGRRRRAAARRRPVHLAPRRRAPPVEPGDDRAAPARRARRRPVDVRGVRARRQRRLGPPLDAARPAPLPRRRRPIPLDEVEPAAEIVKRFSTGAMSLGRSRGRRTRRSPSR